MNPREQVPYEISAHSILYLGFLISTAGLAQSAASLKANQLTVSGVADAPADTPAQLRIAAARHQLKSDPKKVQAYNELALAFLARTRETADSRYLNDADIALAQGLGLDANDFQLQRTQVALMLSRQQFAQAKEEATVLNQRTPDDVMTYGYLAEADIALGNYSEAETNAQWMLNLRPNNIPGLLIGAKLRVLYGDAHGRDRLSQPGVFGDLSDRGGRASLDCQSDCVHSDRVRTERCCRADSRTRLSSCFRAIRTRLRIWRVFAWARIEPSDAVQLWMQAAPDR